MGMEGRLIQLNALEKIRSRDITIYIEVDDLLVHIHTYN